MAGWARGLPPDAAPSHPRVLRRDQLASRGTETVLETTARAGQLHPHNVPSLHPGSRLPRPSKVPRAQERSCRTPWPWRGPRSLRRQRGSASAANPAEKT